MTKCQGSNSRATGTGTPLSAAVLAVCVVFGCAMNTHVGPTFEVDDVSPDEFCESLRSLSPGWVCWRYLGQDETFYYAQNYFRTEVIRVEVNSVDRDEIVEAQVEFSRRFHARLKSHPNEMAIQSGFGSDEYEAWKNSVVLDESLRDEAESLYKAESGHTER